MPAVYLMFLDHYPLLGLEYILSFDFNWFLGYKLGFSNPKGSYRFSYDD